MIEQSDTFSNLKIEVLKRNDGQPQKETIFQIIGLPPSVARLQVKVPQPSEELPAIEKRKFTIRTNKHESLA